MVNLEPTRALKKSPSGLAEGFSLVESKSTLLPPMSMDILTPSIFCSITQLPSVSCLVGVQLYQKVWSCFCLTSVPITFMFCSVVVVISCQKVLVGSNFGLSVTVSWAEAQPARPATSTRAINPRRCHTFRSSSQTGEHKVAVDNRGANYDAVSLYRFVGRETRSDSEPPPRTRYASCKVLRPSPIFVHGNHPPCDLSKS